MAETTEKLGLTLTDESETDMKFLDWRTLMNGTGGSSNMSLIDAAIAALQESLGDLGLSVVDGKLCVTYIA